VLLKFHFLFVGSPSSFKSLHFAWFSTKKNLVAKFQIFCWWNLQFSVVQYPFLDIYLYIYICTYTYINKLYIYICIYILVDKSWSITNFCWLTPHSLGYFGTLPSRPAPLHRGAGTVRAPLAPRAGDALSAAAQWVAVQCGETRSPKKGRFIVGYPLVI
jgi:hypothetical protein